MIKLEEFGLKMAENKDEAFWIEKKELSEKLVQDLEKELELIPQAIEFHKSVAKMCEEKAKQSLKDEE